MKVNVSKTKISLENGYIINRGEYKVNPLEFQFSEEYEGLVKKALFVKDNTKIEQAIVNNTCNIPYEVLNEKDFELRVYAYEVKNELLILRYSPTYVKVATREGSYLEGGVSSRQLTPTQFEQYMQAMNDGLEEVSNVDIDAVKVGHTATVTITNRDGETKSVEIYDGTGGGGGGTSDYLELINKPSINNVTLQGNLTTAQLGIQEYDDTEVRASVNQAQQTANTAKSIAEGANQALSYSNYQALITAFNGLDDDVYNVGQNIYILTLNVPDLWISSIESTSSSYIYTTDNAILEALQTNEYIQVGYYKLSALETQKVDLTNYYTKSEDNTLLGAKVDKSSFVYDSQTETLTITIS